jgi:hypothetical protein
LLVGDKGMRNLLNDKKEVEADLKKDQLRRKTLNI